MSETHPKSLWTLDVVEIFVEIYIFENIENVLENIFRLTLLGYSKICVCMTAMIT